MTELKNRKKFGACRACLNKTNLVNVYCPKCMQRAREHRKHERQTELFRQAVNYGSGELWRDNV